MSLANLCTVAPTPATLAATAASIFRLYVCPVTVYVVGRPIFMATPRSRALTLW